MDGRFRFPHRLRRYQKGLGSALQECSLGRNAVENMIQDVANQDAISKRRAENGNQRFYERINDDDAQAANHQTPSPLPDLYDIFKDVLYLP